MTLRRPYRRALGLALLLGAFSVGTRHAGQPSDEPSAAERASAAAVAAQSTAQQQAWEAEVSSLRPSIVAATQLEETNGYQGSGCKPNVAKLCLRSPAKPAETMRQLVHSLGPVSLGTSGFNCQEPAHLAAKLVALWGPDGLPCTMSATIDGRSASILAFPAKVADGPPLRFSGTDLSIDFSRF